MKKHWKTIGIAAITAAALYYPALKLYQYLKNRRKEEGEEGEEHHVKAFAPAYRGKHKPHHRHPQNGQDGTDLPKGGDMS